jgi:hypothetical protein
MGKKGSEEVIRIWAVSKKLESIKSKSTKTREFVEGM